ncbi:P44/Msp2 family outer membrane protein [Ehrlichia minasensis]|uniref:P44/Msp2 family outer membrane protein n=1 Tax=Ehrlichia minasensis TaxID=1242993 RepID=A0A4Q6I4E1_9RICK|nr:P44/Msp2 family outer membrane protein [Ehrlichia minasensis]RZB12721.1 P44/Msp2 family outer membrane protein [Ehrlichia minasensis]
MNSKSKFFIICTSLICLSSLPAISSSNFIGNSTKHSGLYISGQYKPSVSIFSKFSVKETNTNTVKLVALKKDVDTTSINNGNTGTVDNAQGISKATNFNCPYVADFQDNAFNFSGAIGYSFSEQLKIEIEGSYEEFDAKSPGKYILNDAFRYFALARKMGEPEPSPSPKEDNAKAYYTVMKNDGLSILSIMINGCYNLPLNDLSISPYFCTGIGVDAIEFFDALHLKLAFQSKLGVTYQLSHNISLFTNGYYHQVIGDQFKNLKVQYVKELHDKPPITSAVATLNVGYFGGEIGVRLTL